MVVKNNLFPLPPLFELIQKESGTSWKEMYQVFNMGHRMEIYLGEPDAPFVIDLARSFGIDAQVVGQVEDADGEKVHIESPFGIFEY